MNEKVSYRHNVMSINSIDTFLNVKGGFNNNLRDVYFIRGLGEPDKYIEKISETDKKMRAEMKKGHLTYLRVKALPQLSKIEDSETYSKAFEHWKTDGKLVLGNLQYSNSFTQALENAYANTIAKYKGIKKGVSESILRNFEIKVLYWIDHLFGDAFKGWNERCCIKILAENVVKEQEYLFYYFLTLLGCDVLLLENKKDLEIDEELKRLSDTIWLGDYGTSELEEYISFDLTEQEKKEVIRERSKTDRPNVRIVIPCKGERREKPAEDIPSVSRHSVIHTAGLVKTNSGNIEKTFEELAQLASSIVMITVHDKNSDIIGTGSGIMIGSEGFILTNNHVASGGRFYSVRIEDDEVIYSTDEVIKYNSNLDLAVIRIDRKLKPLHIYGGNRKLVRGQKVVAIGSPLGLFNSVSDGIISGFRSIDGIDMIQFTAPTSHGSSGGAVLNMQGEVIGISTAGIDSGQNINLAVGYENILIFAKGFFD